MTKIIFDATIIHFMSVFSSATRVQPKDCIIEEQGVLFVVPAGEIAKAIGGGGANIKRVERLINRRVRVIEFDDNLITFIENLCYPAKIKEIRQDEDIVTITTIDTASRGQIIGRNAMNLRRVESIAGRYFPLKEIRVK